MSMERDDILNNPIWPDEEIWLSHNSCKVDEILTARWWQQSRLIVLFLSLPDSSDPSSTELLSA